MIVKVLKSILEVSKSSWEAIAPVDFPFASYEFLKSLESSGSIGKRTGWFPYFIVVFEDNRLIGASYLYLKNNSYGEYIFDWSWAEAWQRNGLRYYPKMVGAIPFTPATGLKILCDNLADKREISRLIFREAEQLLAKGQISSVHFLFIPKSEIDYFLEQGYVIRQTFQFHWFNKNYQQFEDFLMALKQKRRHDIRRERKLLAQENLQISHFTGEAIYPYAEIFYQLYLSTIDKKNSADYLTLEFFKELFSAISEKILLILAFRGEKVIAGSLNFFQGKKLFGRYWGAFEEIPFLHFELCYYRPIEYAIQNKIELFEAGAQGEHKLPRGFVPSITYSAHSFPDHSLAKAVKNWIEGENTRVSQFVNDNQYLNYKANVEEDKQNSSIP